jgi:hypothetical protein
MNQNDLSLTDSPIVERARRTCGVVELSDDLVLWHSDLIERVVAMTFDVLGYKTLEIRIRPRIERIDLIAQEQIACQAMN